MVIRRASFLVRSKGASRVVRDLQPILPAARTRQDIIRLGSMTLSPNQLKEAVEPLYVLLAAKRCVQIDSVEKDPVILDLQDVHSTTGPLGTGIAERSTMQREVFEFSMSGLSCAEKAGLDMSLVSDLTGLHSVETDMHRLPIIPSLVYPNFQFSTQSALSDFMGDLVRNSKITINSDGRVLIAASGAEMKDLLSTVAEFYLSRSLTQGRKLSMPVPYDNNHLICLETAKEEVDKIMVTDAPLLFPPGQLALAALRHANEVRRVLDYERYLENMLIRQNSIHSSTELIQHLNAIDSSSCEPNADSTSQSPVRRNSRNQQEMHRYNLLCLEGLAQALRVFNKQEETPQYSLRNISRGSMLKMHVKPETSQIRPYVVSAVLRGITFDEASYNSFIDLQDKLHQNICRIVLSLPPIINGAHPAKTLKTKNVLIECTATDLTKAKIVLNTMVTIFSAYCGKKYEVEPVEVIYSNGESFVYSDLSLYNMEVSLSYVNDSIGVALKAEEVL